MTGNRVHLVPRARLSARAATSLLGLVAMACSTQVPGGSGPVTLPPGSIVGFGPDAGTPGIPPPASQAPVAPMPFQDAGGFPQVADAFAPDEVPTPDAGLPPPEVPEEPSKPAPDVPPPEAPPFDPNDPCQGLDFIGECQGTVLRYCDQGQLIVWDCAVEGLTCGWINANVGNDCGGDPGGDPGGGPEPQPPDVPDQPLPPGSCGTEPESRVVDLVNASRAQQGLRPLACDAAAVRAAQLHSEDQCNMRNMSHTGSDGSDAGTRMRRAGGQFGGWGENVAYGASAPEEVHNMWMNSPGHYANIMGDFGRIGVGHAPCGGSHFWTEGFMD